MSRQHVQYCTALLLSLLLQVLLVQKQATALLRIHQPLKPDSGYWDYSNITPNHCMQVSDSFPFKWINKKWKEGFYVTSMATSHTRWAVVMSRNAGYIDQCVELDFQYPSEGIHRRWDAGAGRPSVAACHHVQCTVHELLVHAGWAVHNSSMLLDTLS